MLGLEEARKAGKLEKSDRKAGKPEKPEKPEKVFKEISGARVVKRVLRGEIFV